MSIRIALSLPRDAETVPLVRDIVMRALAPLRATSERLADIALALGEACANVIHHADDTDSYEVRLEVDGDQCAISVIDTGCGFDVANLTQAMPDPFSARGRGVALMRALVDRIEFTSRPEAGTVVHLVTTLALEEGGPVEA